MKIIIEPGHGVTIFDEDVRLDFYFDKPFRDRVIQTLLSIRKRKSFKYSGHGGFRIAFRTNHYIYKFPVNGKGIEDNFSEYKQFKQYGRKGYSIFKTETSDVILPLAKCRLIVINNIPVLVMELLNNLDGDEILLQEVFQIIRNCEDGNQLGKNSNGNLLCYDYAVNDPASYLGNDDDELGTLTAKFINRLFKRLKL